MEMMTGLEEISWRGSADKRRRAVTYWLNDHPAESASKAIQGKFATEAEARRGAANPKVPRCDVSSGSRHRNSGSGK